MPNKTHTRISVKRLQIDKSQSTMLITTAVAAFMLMFALVGGKALISQISYQNRVISAKKTAVKQLRANVQATASLETSYKAFISTSQNVLGGNPQGTGQQDGDNAKIVLDALPSKYDFPALTSSLEKLISSQNMTIESISGSDDEVAQAGNASSPSPQAIAIPFQAAATGSYQASQGLISVLDKSIRPFKIQKLQLSGGESSMSIKMEAETYYQPAKNFNISKEVVK